jgi:hypothetical protein
MSRVTKQNSKTSTPTSKEPKGVLKHSKRATPIEYNTDRGTWESTRKDDDSDAVPFSVGENASLIEECFEELPLRALESQGWVTTDPYDDKMLSYNRILGPQVRWMPCVIGTHLCMYVYNMHCPDPNGPTTIENIYFDVVAHIDLFQKGEKTHRIAVSVSLC